MRFLPQSLGDETVLSGEIRTPTRFKELETTWGKPGTAAQDHVLQFTANGKTAERRLDDFGRVVAIKNPGQGWQTAHYDEADHLIEKTDPLGNRSQAKYDLAGRLIRVMQTAAGAKTPEQTISLHWLGPRLSEETVRAGDAHGPLLHSTRRSYTLWGQLASEQVTIPTADQAHPVRMQRHLYYSNAGRLLSQTLPNGQRLAYRYYAANAKHPDIDGQLAEIDLISWPSWLDSWFTQLPESSQPKTVLAHFTPHAVSQVTGRDQVAVQPPQIHAGLGTDAPGQQFDAAGLPHRLDTDRGNLQLIWNAAGQLVAVNDSAGHRLASYTYDAQGRRASSRTAQGATYFFYAGTQLLATATQTTEGHTRITGEYVYEGYRPIAWLKPQAPIEEATEFMSDLDAPLAAISSAYSLDTDRRGAVQAVTTLNIDPAQRRTLWQSHINAWGAVTPEGDAQFDPHLRLVNQYADAETGLSYNLARYYDPKAGRYISPDPAGITDSIGSQTPPSLKLDTTAYVSGQPLLYFDPDGAAKIRYFALDNGARTAPGEMPDQGHWGFYIYGIKGSATQLLYDKGGSYFSDPSAPYQLWDADAFTNDLLRDFMNHYNLNGNSTSYVNGSRGFYSPPSFTVDITDEKAKAIISLITNQNLSGKEAGCLSKKANDLPVIDLGVQGKLAPQRDAQNSYMVNGVTQASDGQPNRLISCDASASAQDVLAARLQKAIEVHEVQNGADSIPTDKDCSINGGCPADTWNPAVNEATNQRQPASYGWLQFTPGAILDSLNNLTAAQRSKLGLSVAEVRVLKTRASMERDKSGKKFTKGVAKWFQTLVSNSASAAITVAKGWAGNGAAFAADTGLSQINYDRMVSFGEVGVTLKSIHKKYAATCSKKIGGRAQSDCYWNSWAADDRKNKTTTMQDLLRKANQELGASRVDLNPYIRDVRNMGEARAGFQWAALTAGTVGSKLILILKDKAQYDVLAKVWVDLKIQQAAKFLNYNQTGSWTVMQEERVAYVAASFHNSGNGRNTTYPPKILPIFQTTFCVDGLVNNDNGYLRMDPLRVEQ